MSKIKKYTSFEALKSDEEASAKDNKILVEYKAFLNSLQRQFSSKQQVKGANDKQFS